MVASSPEHNDCIHIISSTHPASELPYPFVSFYIIVLHTPYQEASDGRWRVLSIDDDTLALAQPRHFCVGERANVTGWTPSDNITTTVSFILRGTLTLFGNSSCMSCRVRARSQRTVRLLTVLSTAAAALLPCGLPEDARSSLGLERNTRLVVFLRAILHELRVLLEQCALRLDFCLQSLPDQRQSARDLTLFSSSTLRLTARSCSSAPPRFTALFSNWRRFSCSRGTLS